MGWVVDKYADWLHASLSRVCIADWLHMRRVECIEWCVERVCLVRGTFKRFVEMKDLRRYDIPETIERIDNMRERFMNHIEFLMDASGLMDSVQAKESIREVAANSAAIIC